MNKIRDLQDYIKVSDRMTHLLDRASVSTRNNNVGQMFKAMTHTDKQEYDRLYAQTREFERANRWVHDIDWSTRP
jgi:hypothetical protein